MQITDERIQKQPPNRFTNIWNWDHTLVGYPIMKKPALLSWCKCLILVRLVNYNNDHYFILNFGFSNSQGQKTWCGPHSSICNIEAKSQYSLESKIWHKMPTSNIFLSNVPLPSPIKKTRIRISSKGIYNLSNFLYMNIHKKKGQDTDILSLSHFFPFGMEDKKKVFYSDIIH